MVTLCTLATIIMIDTQLLGLIIYPLLAGCGIALIAGPLGSFVVWRRMAYFGDTLAHSALLGVVLGVIANWDLTFSMMLAGALLAFVLWQLQAKAGLAADTLLGILSHSALALGLIAVSLLAATRINLFGYLFGDLLTVNLQDIVVIVTAGGACLGLLLYFWRPLVMCAIDEELARVEGYPVEKLRLMLMLLIATVVALSMKLVGVMLITALLIIPAAAARRLTRSPEAMAVVAAAIGVFSVVGGLAGSVVLDLPAGPAVVVVAAMAFFLTLACGRNPNH